jgi:hypothetical protein
MKYSGSLFLLLCYSTAFAQSSLNAARADTLWSSVTRKLYDKENKLYYETTKEKNENPHSFLWPLCGLIQAANEMEALHKGQSYMPAVIAAIDQYYDPKPPTPGYDSYVVKEKGGDRFYDDNQWIAIAYMDAWKRTKKKWYLEKATEIYKFMMSGFDTISGGGLYWREGDKGEKNTCSNGPGVLVALQLYNATKDKSYLDTALLLYNWVNKYLQAPEGYYYDGLRLPKQEINSATYTYNAGTMLESNVRLYQITHNKQYLKAAQHIAAGSYAHFFRNGRFPYTYWFNAVLLRGYEALYAVDGNRQYINAMQEDADKVWATEKDSSQLVGRKADKDLLGQTGMMEIYARLARIK